MDAGLDEAMPWCHGGPLADHLKWYLVAGVSAVTIAGQLDGSFFCTSHSAWLAKVGLLEVQDSVEKCSLLMLCAGGLTTEKASGAL